MVHGDPRMTALHCHPKDTLSPRPPLPSGHLLSPRTDVPENLAWILVRTLTVVLSLPESGAWASRAQEWGTQNSPRPLTTPPLHVQHLVHTPVPPGAPGARGGEPCFPGLTSDLATSSPPREVEVRPRPQTVPLTTPWSLHMGGTGLPSAFKTGRFLCGTDSMTVSCFSLLSLRHK